MRIFAPLLLLVLAGAVGGTGSSFAQAAPTASSADRTAAAAATPDAMKRNEMLKPGLELLKKGDAVAALTALHPALEAYPNDLAVLTLCAQVAVQAHQDAAALDLFSRALKQDPPEPWHIRVAILPLEAHLGRWPDFYRDQAALRKAQQDGEKELSATTGYLVDDFSLGGRAVQVAYFPTLAGRYKTLYRFILPGPPAASASPASGDEDRCRNPNFHPYIEVESDDVDQSSFQAKHPDLAAKGGRSYSLDSYPAACSQALIKFYPDGEPTYQTVRADVLKFLNAIAVTKEPVGAKP